MKKLFLLALITTFITAFASAQVLPPDFLCVRGDTLLWELPVNNCGPFNSYDIYASQSSGGPFVLLASVTDPAKKFYFHPNPGGQTWYYYLVSNYNCPGQIALPSDTLDNRPPVISPVSSVSVEDGNVEIEWKASPSPEVFAYIIYRETSIGVVPVDTVFSGTTYTDTGADPNLKSESYFVNALDRCGNTSIFDLKHSTIFLEGTVSPCEQLINLNWNLYENWGNGIGSQEVWTGINGATPALVETIAANATSYKYANVNDGDDYCIFIKAIEQGTGEASKSTQICVTAAVVNPARDFYVKNVTFNAAGEVEVTWGWNTTSEIKSVEILRASQNSGYQSVVTQTPQFPLSPLNTFTDPAISVTGQFYYKIRTTDDCDTLALSTYGSTIYLTGIAQPDNTNLLNWTALDIQNAAATSFDIYRILNSVETKIATTTGAGTSHNDPFDPASFGGTGACYYVIATATLTTPDGSKATIQSRSNTACVEQQIRVFVPNAFAPLGFNQEFKPLLVPAEAGSYEMRIFDRYGQELFVSNNPKDGWNGKKNGKEMPQGAYVYRILITQSSGKRVEKSGTVLLLR